MPASGFAAAQVANSATSKLCAPDAPESYKRAGGYCDQIDRTDSLVPTQENASPCPHVADADFRFDEIQDRLQVAVNPCCGFGFNLEQLPVAGILVAC
jgi:hypothetical protein